MHQPTQSPFEADIFDESYYSPFHKFAAEGSLSSDLCGWVGARSPAAEIVPLPRIKRQELSQYYIDEGRTIEKLKKPIIKLLSAWENSKLDSSEVTLTHSVSAATFITLTMLRSRGIKEIIFETPAYGVTMRQAEHLGLACSCIPTFKAESFQFNLPYSALDRTSPCAIWITQPRMSLGFNQSIAGVGDLLKRLSNQDFLVVDEATEQLFPSHLSSLRRSPQVLRLRGLVKGAGLNGLRLAAVLHDSTLRPDVEDAQEMAGNSLDVFSLRTAGEIAARPVIFQRMLSAANQRTVKSREALHALVAGTPIVPSALVNGYIGSLALSVLGSDKKEFRRKLLDYSHKQRLPLILGPSMRFAWDANWEYVRVNYFKDQRDLVSGVRLLQTFLQQFPLQA